MEEITVNSLGFLLDRALWTLSSTLNATLKEKGIDLPHSQYIIMRFLDEKEGISQNKLAILLHKDAAAIKRSIDNLEKKGLLIRKALSERKNGIYLTDKGKALIPKVKTIADEILGGTFGQTEEMRHTCILFWKVFISIMRRKVFYNNLTYKLKSAIYMLCLLMGVTLVLLVLIAIEVISFVVGRIRKYKSKRIGRSHSFF